MLDFLCKESYDLRDFVALITFLRSPGGCPWDQVQTHESIRRNFLEETYEACEAIDAGDTAHLKEELGDVLLQVVFHSSIEEDAGRFDLDDVADGVCRKLIYRHPHVFGDVSVQSTDEILSNWEDLKKKEKGQATQADAVDAVARTLPALWRAEKLQKKAEKAQIPVEFPEVSAAVNELEKQPDKTQTVGKLLFAAVQAARQSGVDPEMALHGYCETFIRQVNYAGKE